MISSPTTTITTPAMTTAIPAVLESIYPPLTRYNRPHSPLGWLPALTATVLLAAALPVGAQHPRAVTGTPELRQALESLRTTNAWTLEQQVSLCEIPAPPFREARRAEEYRRRMVALGLQNVRIDREGNVIGERRGTGSGPAVVLSGHLDTVFPEGTDVRVTRTGTRYEGPGIADDCRGLAVVLAVAKAMQDARVRTAGTIYFVGTVGEEGPGNLRGVRHLFAQELKGRVDYFISVDGTGHGVVSRAVGSNRYRVRFEGPGGHSYGAFGMPNPVHALGRAIAAISELQVPATPRTTFSVGMIEGGTSVNSIAASASMEVDLRSESPEELARLDAEMRRRLSAALEAERARWPESSRALALRIDTMGIRPAARQPDSAPIVIAAQESAQALGVEPRATAASSTDANLPMSLGIPAITIGGGGRGGSAHALDEWYDDGDRGWLGPQWALLIVMRLTGG
jgi:tripeptide aminopeptidase